jgi:hypothetical protein
MNNQNTLVLFAVIAALGIVSVVAVDVILTTQEADAKCQFGSQGYIASKGKCRTILE